MRKIFIISLALILLGAGPAMADDNQPQSGQAYNQGYGYQGMGPGMMGPGYGRGMMGPGMMGPGYGGHMMGPGYGRGMMGPGYGRGYGMGPGRQGWQNMSPADQKKWQDMRSKFLQQTLPLRQEMATKQMELQTLWNQPNPDQGRINQLSDEVADLRAKLDKQRNRFLGQCRQQFGDRGWSCPGASW